MSRPKGLALLCPWRRAEQVLQIDPAWLKSQGVDTVLVDVDNTLVGWQRGDIREEVVQWVNRLKQEGFKLYIVSNARHDQRLIDLANRLGLPFVKRAWKPSKRGFRTAMSELGSQPASTVMIGDQVFTDVLGANRLGVRPILVTPIARKEFFGTKISRALERILMAHFHRQGMLHHLSPGSTGVVGNDSP